MASQQTLATTATNSASVAISEVRIEHQREAFGIGESRPRLSWMVATATQNWAQAGYEIALHDAQGTLLGQTGRIASDQSVYVGWPFAALNSRDQVRVAVRVWGTDGSATAWSEPVTIEAGLLHASDWSGRFITPGWDEDRTKPQPAPMLRGEFEVHGNVRQARLYITAQGVYEAQLNGAAVGDLVMAPGWTSYNHRLRYQTFDVTSLLQVGQNALGATVADGWYRGRLGFGGGRRTLYGTDLSLLAQLEITYADGSTQTIVTDGTWRAATGPILASDIYDGETYDARLARPGWSQAGYDDHEWRPVRTVERDFATLEAPIGPPLRRMELVRPKAIITTPSGKTILDFGQNLVGRLRLTVNGPAGHTITLRHAEVLENGELGVRPLRTAKATDQYTLRGGEDETWEPSFTFHGFRYAEISYWPGTLTPEASICAVVCHSDMQRTGWFETSHVPLNRLHENVLWSMRGNFFDLPTDCPQRDERLGWTGDIQVFAPTASFLYDTSGFLASWLKDVAAEQREAGDNVPVVVPNTIPGPTLIAAAWSDAAVIVPWVQYQRFGDREILAAQFESMCAWVDRIVELAGPSRLWDQGFQFGDWLDPRAPATRPEEALTNRHLVATAYFAYSADLVSQAAGVLGLTDAESRYHKLAEEVRAAFANEYITPSGRLLSDAQTAYALAFEFGLIPTAEQRKRAADRLLDLVRASGYHIETGFVGTPLICDALCTIGKDAAAYRLLLQEECPSWLYPVTMGATTIWERWDSMLPDGSINPGEMTSFNHYALGAVADWMHRVVGGLAPAAPGYRRMTIQPRPGDGLTHASARHITPYGLAECAWKIHDGVIDVQVTVPPNTTASVVLPGSGQNAIEIGSGTYTWSYAYQQEVTHTPLTIDHPVGEIVDDVRAWSVIVETLQALDPENPVAASRLYSQNTTLRQGLMMMPHSERMIAGVDAALTRLAQSAG